MTDFVQPGGGTPGVLCRFCGNAPAVQTTFRQHTGMVILMKFNSIEGPFCRNCGLYAFRSTTGHTLLGGWWGWASSIIAPITMIINLVRRRKVARLAPPVIGPEGRTPADPGKPLYQRTAIIGLAFPVLIIAFFAFVIISDRPQSQVGKCVAVAANQVDVDFVSCSSSHDGVVTQIVDKADDCPTTSLGAVSRVTSTGSNYDDGQVLCIGPDA